MHSFSLSLDWQLIRLMSRIDRFDASWGTIEKKEGQRLTQLKSIATVRSVGASTRIEGSLLTDEEVGTLLNSIDITRISDRDSQEVIGYFDALDLISESCDDIAVTENSVKHLHGILLRHSTKDQWHRGGYKQHSNVVEARLPDGTTQVIFETTPPGYPTEDAMRDLFDWYGKDNDTHPLIKCALFTYDFLSVHPFQDGNGRLSRLLSTLLLMKHGYGWVRYVSFEHEIEHRKTEYYRVLRNCQSQRPNEDVTEWVRFFLETLGSIQEQLMEKMETQGVLAGLSHRERSVLTFIEHHPGCRSGEIAKQLDIPVPTVKRMLPHLIALNLIERHGSGPGTSYTIR